MIGCVNTPDVSRVSIDNSIPTINNLRSLSSITQVGLEWTPIYSEQIEGYYIYRGEEGKSKLERIATIKDRYASHFLDEGLKPQTMYKYKISVLSVNGKESIPSESLIVHTKPRPEALPFVKAIIDLPNRIKIIWRPHPFVNINSYIVQRKKPTSKEWKNHAEVKGRLSAEYIDKGLSDNKAYLYRVLARTNNGVLSIPSEVVGGATKSLPQTILNLHATTNEPKKITLTWNPSPNKDIVYYKVYSSPTSMLLFTYLAKTKDTKFEDLIDTNGKTRYYKVTAVDNDDLESKKQDEPVMGKTLSAPSAPVATSASYNGYEVYITWNSGRDMNVQNYEILKKFKGQEQLIRHIQGNSFTDTNLLPNEKYEYIIYAVDKYGLRSTGSNSVFVETKKEMN